MEDYSKTLNLPKTNFQMKANLATKEPEILKFWNNKNIYQNLRNRSIGKDMFILHDGPPYANGNIHLGTAFNKILKDIIVRFFSMNGFDAPYIPGWDCHGLPIEHQVMKSLGKDNENTDILEIRKKCKIYAENFVGIQREEFKRLGVYGDWERPYLTMDYEYEAAIIKEFQSMVKKGYVYRGNKPIYWCFTCQTALAEAEVEYNDHTSPSVYVTFNIPYKNIKNIFSSLPEKDVSIVIWTTTPWTLPGNTAIALDPEALYVFVEDLTNNNIYILAQKLMDKCMEKFGINKYKTLGEIKGKALEGIKAQHPFVNRESQIVLASYVELETGTGCVHTAPGHGQEDYETGQKYNLPILSPVDSKGRFTDEVPEYSGKNVFKANTLIIQELVNKGKLLAQESISHSYPHCWRCKNPVIFRATAQWFVSLDNQNELRKKALENLRTVEWIPRWGIDRISNMIKDRPDWCISRQRAWGVAIPAIYCEKCNEAVLNDAFIERVKELTKTEGSDVWFKKSIKEIYAGELTCPKCGSHSFRKENDILDVWFDSGASHEAVLKNKKRYGLDWPADLYLEGSDQHRGWFHSTMLIATATNITSPYKRVLTHGFVVDGQGRKMSKSLGNVVSPQEVIKKYGADILRLWVSSENYQEDIRISDEILTRLSEAYRKIRNTARFILGNLNEFDPNKDLLPYNELQKLDKWALFKLQEFVRHSTLAYDKYEFHNFYHGLQNFCANEMSSIYLDIIKDRLYIESSDSIRRRSTQSALYIIIVTLTRLMAPVLVHTSEEIWQHLPKTENMEESIHLASFPHLEEKYILSDDEHKQWNTILDIKNRINVYLEEARKNKVIGHSLDSHVILKIADKNLFEILNNFADELVDILIVSKVSIEEISKEFLPPQEEQILYKIQVEKAPGDKCVRCWKYDEKVDKDKGSILCPRCSDILNKEKIIK
ncbi:MAG: isoleucine--tRNA ligase [Candidatus Firestonebacteria bacterium]|nr:isoleucine--tRNA ligase [Candidatus Firestonebacteria bacterium]